MNLRAISGIARPLDFEYRTNRWIAGLAGAVLLIATLVRALATGDWLGAAGWGAWSALGVFLAWALARELDPDRDPAAFLAAGLAGVALLLTGLPDIAALFVVLLAVRVLNRTTGVGATPLDGIGLLGLGLWLALGGTLLYLAVGAVALTLDGLLPPANRRRALLGVAGAAVAAAVLVLAGAEHEATGVAPLPIAGGLAVAALFAVVIARTRHVESLADVTRVPLAASRVQAGQVAALVTGLAAVVLQGGAGLVGLMPLWAAMLAVVLYRLVKGPLG